VRVIGKPLRVCIVGKYPPIEGGVSTTTYWLARGLAARRHEVHVVTNADEVENRYRMRLDAGDAAMLQPRFDNGGFVRVHHVESFDPVVMAHIPAANPYFTRLASVATDVVRRHGCKVVLASYFEPYGMAGWFAAQRCDRPLLLRHAASDIDRLARVPDLALAYKEILRDAAAVVTFPRLVRRFAGLGVDPARIIEAPRFRHDPHFFTSAGAALDIDAIKLDGDALRSNAIGPTIGVYGKVSAAKGTFDLVAALGRLAAEGRSFRLAAMVGDEFGARLQPSLIDAGIADRTVILPFLPNWRVPEFIRACTAVCFLERGFPVAIHGPMIAREVLACGGCLIVSKEIADKQPDRARLVDGTDLLVVDDPRDIDELTDRLRTVVDDPAAARRIGAAGAQKVADPNAYDGFIGAWEELFDGFRGGAALAPRSSREARRAALEVAVPGLLRYAETVQPAVVDRFLAGGGDAALPGCALNFCSALGRNVPTEWTVERRAVYADALRYAAARLRAGFDEADGPPPFAVVDALHDRTFRLEDAAGLYPVRGNSAVVEEFDYDVSQVFAAELSNVDPLAEAEKRHCMVLFHRSVNLVPCELEVNAVVLTLLELCDGSRTTDEVIDAVAARHGDGDADKEQVREALRRLYASGVIVFGRRDPAWGWAKGERSSLAELPPLRSPVR
jgi:glycosyltransferase involved in cell wall biosynthesis